MPDRLAYPSTWPTLAWRHYEEARGLPLRDAAIEAAAMTAGAALPARIAARARAFCARTGIDALLSLRARRLRQVAALITLLGALGGFAAARLIPAGAPARANLFDLLGALLLPNLAALALWVLLQLTLGFRTGGARGNWLGQLVQQGVERATAGGAGSTEETRAVHRALLEYHGHTAAGRMRLAVISHRFWLALALGAMLGSGWLLSLRQVDFYWGSTLLGADTMTRAFQCLAQPVAWLGFPVPDAADMALSRVDVSATDPAVRARWGWFLLAALFVFGVLPRAAALALCMALATWHERHFVPDPALPGYWRLQSILVPPASSSRVIDPDDGEPAVAQGTEPRFGADAPPATAAWLALERALPVPPGAIDLGTVVERADQQRILAALAAGPAWPALVIQAPLAGTPDRGIAQFIGHLVASAQRPLYLCVSDHADVELAPADRAARRDDWRALAERVGIPPARIDAGSP